MNNSISDLCEEYFLYMFARMCGYMDNPGVLKVDDSVYTFHLRECDLPWEFHQNTIVLRRNLFYLISEENYLMGICFGEF